MHGKQSQCVLAIVVVVRCCCSFALLCIAHMVLHFLYAFIHCRIVYGPWQEGRGVADDCKSLFKNCSSCLTQSQSQCGWCTPRSSSVSPYCMSIQTDSDGESPAAQCSGDYYSPTGTHPIRTFITLLMCWLVLACGVGGWNGVMRGCGWNGVVRGWGVRAGVMAEASAFAPERMRLCTWDRGQHKQTEE